MSSNIRNIAIIAHVDHGKTTLVDKILLQCETLKQSSATKDGLIMDNNELEKERGITILSKNAAVSYKDHKINIIDTPGHADFGGEVERVLNMADGVLLLVDAFEGPMPQTRYVLKKALEIGKLPIVVVNKVDKPNCDPVAASNLVFDLMFALDATEEQIDFPVIYGSAKHGWMSTQFDQPTDNIFPLLDTVISHIPPPEARKGDLQFQVTSIDYSNYLGRIALGRIYAGSIKEGQSVSLVKRDGTIVKDKIKDIFVYEGLNRKKVSQISAGDICAVHGLENFDIGDTICDPENPVGLPVMHIDEPTMSILFTINNSPLYGKDGKFVTSRHLKDRLEKEMEKNLALKMEQTDSADSFLMYGRGVLHLSVLIETMRREGYELQVGQPKVIVKQVDGVKCEPVEFLNIDTPENFSGKIIDLVSSRKGTLLNMINKYDTQQLEFEIPARGIIGLRSKLMNISSGRATMSHRFIEFQPHKGDIPSRLNGVLVACEDGTTMGYAIFNLQDRGKFFINPGDTVYEGMVVGEHNRNTDLLLNVTKTKKLTNVRASGSDEKIRLEPPVQMSLEELIEYIQEDEYVEITPNHLRLRKIYLKENERKIKSSKSSS